MEESNPNQARRRGHQSPTGGGQGLESESDIRRREHDRSRRRRDALRAQQDPFLRRTYPAFSAILPSTRQRDNFEDELMRDSESATKRGYAFMLTRTHFPTAGIRVMSSSPTNNPVPPDVRHHLFPFPNALQPNIPHTLKQRPPFFHRRWPRLQTPDRRHALCIHRQPQTPHPQTAVYHMAAPSAYSSHLAPQGLSNFLRAHLCSADQAHHL